MKAVVVEHRGDERLPFVLGQDFAGIVSEMGGRVRKYRTGERVTVSPMPSRISGGFS